MVLFSHSVLAELGNDLVLLFKPPSLLAVATHGHEQQQHHLDRLVVSKARRARDMGKKTKRINQFVKLQQQKIMVARQLRQLLGQNQALRQREQVQWRKTLSASFEMY
jgi:hypothetical protein